MWLRTLLSVVIVPHLGWSTPVDNGVEGPPEIVCGTGSVTISFNTRNPFEGHLYVKNHFSTPGCRTDTPITNGGKLVAAIELPFDKCSVIRTRSLNPKGVFVSAVLIISFHRYFETKVDRAYNIQCFYMEAEKTVLTDLEASPLTSESREQNVPMPKCRYDILTSPSGPAVKFAIVGQPVYHKWTCDTETVNVFCMRVHSCFISDLQGDKVMLLDENGCAQDKFLLGNLEYNSDLMAGRETHVFKYADKVQLGFQCQVSIGVKEPLGKCPLPTCAEPQKGKRSAQQPPFPHLHTLDVAVPMVALELDTTDDLKEFVERHQHSDQPIYTAELTNTNNICVRPLGLGLISGFGMLMLLVMLGTSIFIHRQRTAHL